MYLNRREHERTAEAKVVGVSVSAHGGETLCSFLVPFTAFSCPAKQDGSAAIRDWLICMHEMKLFLCVRFCCRYNAKVSVCFATRSAPAGRRARKLKVCRKHFKLAHLFSSPPHRSSKPPGKLMSKARRGAPVQEEHKYYTTINV